MALPDDLCLVGDMQTAVTNNDVSWTFYREIDLGKIAKAQCWRLYFALDSRLFDCWYSNGKDGMAVCLEFEDGEDAVRVLRSILPPSQFAKAIAASFNLQR